MPEDNIPRATESYEFEDADEVRPLDYDPMANDPMSLEELSGVDEENRPEYFMDTTTCPNIDQGADGAVKIKFFGCNSLYITDGETNILIDPLFTRPRASMDSSYARRQLIRPSPEIIRETLRYAEIDSVDAILVSHAHWDHALDVGEIWNQLNPPDNRSTQIYGCNSTLRIAMGADVPDEYITRPVLNRIFEIGSFKVAFIPGAHVPLPRGCAEATGGHIERILTPPARVDDYKMGEICDIIIQHEHGTILNKGSLNYVPGYLQNLMQEHCSAGSGGADARIDVLILGIAGYRWMVPRFAITVATAVLFTPILGAVLDRELGGRESMDVRRGFWEEVVATTNPYLMLFSHWDEFTEGRENLLDRPPSWMMGARAISTLERQERSHHRSGERHGLQLNRHIPIRYIPFWKELTVLPINHPNTGERVPSLFRLPDGDSLGTAASES